VDRPVSIDERLLDLAVRAGFVDAAAAAELRRAEAELRAAGTSPGLAGLLAERHLEPGQLAELRSRYARDSDARARLEDETPTWIQRGGAGRQEDETPTRIHRRGERDGEDETPTRIHRRPGSSAGGPAEFGERPGPGVPPVVRIADHPAFWRPGTPVDGYVLGDLVGEGGMGYVYAAEDPRTGEPCAVKIARASLDATGLRRFQREVRSLRSLGEHPGVVRIRAAGAVGRQPYVVMDLARGGSLSGRLAAGPLRVDEAARIGAAVARALAEAHRRGIVHRDLKPANVLFDAEGIPLLTDFGLARVEGAGTLTRPRAQVGTLLYMAPEQLQDPRVDGRADVYALGVTLYEALTGELPFSGERITSVLIRVLNEPPRPPSRLAFGLPAGADAVCLRALAKAPEDRYPDALAFAEDLERLERDEPVAAAPVDVAPPSAEVEAAVVERALARGDVPAADLDALREETARAGEGRAAHVLRRLRAHSAVGPEARAELDAVYREALEGPP